jgi:hypothetical protein
MHIMYAWLKEKGMHSTSRMDTVCTYADTAVVLCILSCVHAYTDCMDTTLASSSISICIEYEQYAY